MRENRLEIWTPENLDWLKRLWFEGKSGGIIAREMGQGFTRSAIMGKARRLGLMGRGKPPNHHSKHTEMVKKPPKKRIRKLALKAPPRPVIVRPPPPASGVPLLELEAWHCRSVTGHSNDRYGLAVFCGEVVQEGKRYCPKHCKEYYYTPARRDGEMRLQSLRSPRT